MTPKFIQSGELAICCLFDLTQCACVLTCNDFDASAVQKTHSFLQLGSPNMFSSFSVPESSPSRGGDVAVYVFDINQPSLPTPFYSVLVSISIFVAL